MVFAASFPPSVFSFKGHARPTRVGVGRCSVRASMRHFSHPRSQGFYTTTGRGVIQLPEKVRRCSSFFVMFSVYMYRASWSFLLLLHTASIDDKCKRKFSSLLCMYIYELGQLGRELMSLWGPCSYISDSTNSER